MSDTFYNSPEWRELRKRVLARDGGRCTVGRFLPGICYGRLHVHHIEARTDRPDLELDETNCATVCATHHPTWERLRRFLARPAALPPCGHMHRYAHAQRLCDERRARERGLVLANTG